MLTAAMVGLVRLQTLVKDQVTGRDRACATQPRSPEAA